MVIERKFIEDAIVKDKVSKFLEKNLTRAGFSRVEIQKTPLLTRITVYVTTPGKVIGRGGETINMLTDTLKNKFHVDNPQISVAEVSNPRLEPRLVARYVANSLERGANARSLLHSVVRDIMMNGALGAEVIASGKLAAKGAKKRKIKVRLGYMPMAGDTVKLVDAAALAAYPKYGAIGIKVRIVQPGTVFPDRQVKQIELPKNIAAAGQ
ncbi:MAG: 30S ribosomal protein S3 [Candidatus Micrarchaeota archaeon]|nr:30S ribosomal protein S3 [Candidatus Micrarchaeota archaeon]